jgi:hypothetical protein
LSIDFSGRFSLTGTDSVDGIVENLVGKYTEIVGGARKNIK